MKISLAVTLVSSLVVLSACSSKDPVTPQTFTPVASSQATALMAPAQATTPLQVTAPVVEDMASLQVETETELPLVDAAMEIEAPEMVVQSAETTGTSGPKTNISVPVDSDDSYSTAASKAQAHCSQWDVDAGAPFKATNTTGQTVLTYNCL